MPDIETVIPDRTRFILQALREESDLSQSSLAERLGCAASRVSRLESGELKLDTEEAIRTAGAIGTPKALEFAEYLRQPWLILPRPAFSHVNRTILCNAERSLQRLDSLRQDPNLRHAFVEQLDSLARAIQDTAEFLSSTDHPVAFIGRIGIGKTTAICSLADLIDKAQSELQKMTLLHTGKGRTTICEVEIRYGGEYGISIDPCSDEELRIFISEFCDDLLRRVMPERYKSDNDEPPISRELSRALRNMTGLFERTERTPDGKSVRRNLGVELVKTLTTTEHDLERLKSELLLQVWTRLDLVQRNRTSIRLSADSAEDAYHWLRNVFRDINIGKHPEFSLPRRIVVNVPQKIFRSESYNLRIIDTRGIDETKAIRRDIQTHLDDPRAVIVLASGFEDAPDAAAQTVFDWAIGGGATDALHERTLLMVLSKNGEEKHVNDDETGESVASVEDGRLIKASEVQAKLSGRKDTTNLPVIFLDAQRVHDPSAVRSAIIERIDHIRNAAVEKIRDLITTAERLIADRDKAEIRAVYAQAMRPLHDWLATRRTIPASKVAAHTPLPEDIGEIRYAATLRASVSRKGDWYNFNFWHAIGFGLRENASKRTIEIAKGLRPLFETAFANDDFEPAHGVLRHLQTLVSEHYKDFLRSAEELGEVAFKEQLKGQETYWRSSQDRWGQGSGYNQDIRKRTMEVLDGKEFQAIDEMIERELERKWQKFIDGILVEISKTTGDFSDGVE